jgi:hypothetical protein
MTTLQSIPEYVQVTPGKCPGPAYVPTGKLVWRLQWQPLPLDPTQAIDDDRPGAPQGPGG